MAKISGLSLGQINKISGLALGSIKKVSGLGLGTIWSSFLPSGMTRNGGATALTASYVEVPGWAANTSSYPGSTVTGNALRVNGAKDGATVQAAIPLSGGYQYTAQIQIKINGVVAVVGPTTTTSPMTASVAANVRDGDLVTVEMKSTTSFSQPTLVASSGTASVT